MNSWELFEAMTDLEDDTILAVAQPTPRRRVRVMSLLRPLAAACLVLVMVFSILLVNEAEAGTNQIRWTRRVRDNEFYYVFWNTERPETPMPTYRMTWVPEEYKVWSEQTSELQYTVICHHVTNSPNTIWFSYYYLGNGDEHHFSYEKGSYTYTETTVNGQPADLYELEEFDGGILIWFDREKGLVFSLRYDCDKETAMYIAQNVMRMEGELE